MIKEFAVENYRSIKDRQTISFQAVGKIGEYEKNVIPFNDGSSLLKTTILYGPNASGKSNLLKALNSLKEFVSESSNYKIDQTIKHYQPFRLTMDSTQKPTRFEIDFIAQDSIRYKYEVSFFSDAIYSESLFFYPKKQPAKLFIRTLDQSIDFGITLKGDKKSVERQLGKNVLFLSKGANSEIEQLKTPYLFFRQYLFVSLGTYPLSDQALIRGYTKIMADKPNSIICGKNLSKLVKIADTGIERIDLAEIPIEKIAFPKSISDEQKQNILDNFKFEIKTIHKTINNDKSSFDVSFDLDDESAGTVKLIAVGGMILDALSDGTFLVIDELDKSLHPKLTRVLINLFHNSKTNPRNAQLLFATHDISLLDNSLFRRDQIWFSEKEANGETRLYSLSDFNGVRKETPFDTWYLTGRFGALPSIDESELFFEKEDEKS